MSLCPQPVWGSGKEKGERILSFHFMFVKDILSASFSQGLILKLKTKQKLKEILELHLTPIQDDLH